MSDTSHGWKTLSSRTVYESQWMRLTEDEVLSAGGVRSTYGVARYPSAGCSILALDADGHTWIVGQYRYAIDRYTWEIPAGGIGADSTPLQGAQRELSEETGLTAAHWLEFLHLAPINAMTNLESHGFLAWDVTPGPVHPDPGEELTVRRLPFAEVLDMVLRGDISSSVSVSVVLQAHVRALRGQMPPEINALLRAGR